MEIDRYDGGAVKCNSISWS